MPTYDYACSNCGNVWEAEQRITEPALDTCPKCNEKTAKRQISGGAGFILKGGGWYSDLYGSSNKGVASSSTSSPTSSSSSSTSSTSTAAPATPAPATSSSSGSSSGSSS